MWPWHASCSGLVPMNANFLSTPVASLSQQILTQLKDSSPWELMRPHAAAARIICETTGYSALLADAAGTNFVSAYFRPDENGNRATANTLRMLLLQWSFEGAEEVTDRLRDHRLSHCPILGRPLFAPGNAALLGAVLCERPDDPRAERHLAALLEVLAPPLAEVFEERG